MEWWNKSLSMREFRQGLQLINWNTQRIVKCLVTERLCLELLRTADPTSSQADKFWATLAQNFGTVQALCFLSQLTYGNGSALFSLTGPLSLNCFLAFLNKYNNIQHSLTVGAACPPRDTWPPACLWRGGGGAGIGKLVTDTSYVCLDLLTGR